MNVLIPTFHLRIDSKQSSGLSTSYTRTLNAICQDVQVIQKIKCTNDFHETVSFYSDSFISITQRLGKRLEPSLASLEGSLRYLNCWTQIVRTVRCRVPCQVRLCQYTYFFALLNSLQKSLFQFLSFSTKDPNLTRQEFSSNISEVKSQSKKGMPQIVMQVQFLRGFFPFC